MNSFKHPTLNTKTEFNYSVNKKMFHNRPKKRFEMCNSLLKFIKENEEGYFIAFLRIL